VRGSVIGYVSVGSACGTADGVGAMMEESAGGERSTRKVGGPARVRDLRRVSEGVRAAKWDARR
jgi:hypothetical protein